jgi:hypothetical protein
MSKRILFTAMSLVIALAMGILPAGVGHAQSPICHTGTLPGRQYSNCLTDVGPTVPNHRQVNVRINNTSNWSVPAGASTSISCALTTEGHVIHSLNRSANGTWNLHAGFNISLRVGYTYAMDCTHSWSFGSLFTVNRSTHTEISL